MNIISAHSPAWANAQHDCITLMVLFKEHQALGDLRFGAHPEDTEPHGRELFDRAVAGEFGPVVEFEPHIFTPEEVRAQKLAEIASIESANSLPRPIREAMLMMLPDGIQKTKIKAIDDQITSI